MKERGGIPLGFSGPGIKISKRDHRKVRIIFKLQTAFLYNINSAPGFSPQRPERMELCSNFIKNVTFDDLMIVAKLSNILDFPK